MATLPTASSQAYVARWRARAWQALWGEGEQAVSRGLECTSLKGSRFMQGVLGLGVCVGMYGVQYSPSSKVTEAHVGHLYRTVIRLCRTSVRLPCWLGVG